MEDPLLDVAQEMYSLAPAEFTEARNSRAKSAGATGDADLTRRIKALRKPSVPAWGINQLMRREAVQMAQVLEMGEALRRASDQLDADKLRVLTRQRRALTSAVTLQARRLGSELGVKVTEAAAQQIEQTLHAAMVDDRAAAAVRSGLLVSALVATGVDPVDVTSALAVPDALGSIAAPIELAALSVVPDPRRAEQERKAREQAKSAVRRAEAELRGAVELAATLEARGLQLQEELEELRRRQGELEHRAEGVEEELSAAEDDRVAAEKSLTGARRVLDQTRSDPDAPGPE